MMVDDHLRRAFDTLSDRLRGEMNRQVQAALDELAASAREQREAAVAAAVAAANADRDEAVAAAAASAGEARDEAVASAVAAASAAHQEALASAVASARAERDEALAAALASARAEREAAVAAAQASAAAPAAAPATSPDLIVDVAEGTRAMSQATSLTGVLDELIRAASASGATASVWLVRGARLEFWRSSEGGERPPIATDADDPAAKAARTRTSVLQDETLAFPVALAGEPVAVLTTASFEAPAPSPYAIEILALYASRALEAITAFKTARALTAQQSADKESSAAQPAATSADAPGEEHASARRYAKLLVSEIKLYHEAEVVEGQRVRDLATRLGGEISRARMMYEQRVPPDVRRQADYFHEELVRTLANGDRALLEARS